MATNSARQAYVDQHRERICAWLVANGIDPNDVPVDAVLGVADNVITFPVYLRNDQGRLFVDESGDRAARGVDTCPLVAEPGETVARWLLWSDADFAQRTGVAAQPQDRTEEQG